MLVRSHLILPMAFAGAAGAIAAAASAAIDKASRDARSFVTGLLPSLLAGQAPTRGRDLKSAAPECRWASANWRSRYHPTRATFGPKAAPPCEAHGRARPRPLSLQCAGMGTRPSEDS